MRIVIQRIEKARVTCENCEESNNDEKNNIDNSNDKNIKKEKPFNEISKGIVAYVGFSKEVNEEKVERAASKLLNLRVFKENKDLYSLKDKGYEILVISNFTLQGIQKGRRINYKNCLEAEKASYFYELLLKKLRENYNDEKVKNGFFQKMMKVEVVLDGPFNFVLDL